MLNLEIDRLEKVPRRNERIKRLERSLSKNLILDPESLYAPDNCERGPFFSFTVRVYRLYKIISANIIGVPVCVCVFDSARMLIRAVFLPVE